MAAIEIPDALHISQHHQLFRLQRRRDRPGNQVGVMLYVLPPDPCQWAQ